MKTMILMTLSFVLMPLVSFAIPKTDLKAGAAEEAKTQKITYKSGKDVNFEALLIQGKLKRPDVSVVTGNVAQGADGLLRLRENFVDRVASDAGEESNP